MPSELDQKILSILESRNPERIDELMAAVGRAFAIAHPYVSRKAKRYMTAADAEDAASKTTLRALQFLTDQLHGNEFPYQYREGEFKNWLLRVAGAPGAKRKSGVIGADVKRLNINNQRSCNIDEHAGSLAADAPDELQSAAKTIDESQLLRPLLPRERFAIVYCFGLRDGAINAKAVIDAARQLGFGRLDLAQLARNAKALFLNSATLPRLTYQQIGLLLGVGERQVQNILAGGLTKMRAAQPA